MVKEKSVILIGFMPNPRIYKRIAVEKELFELHLICWDKGRNMLLQPEGKEYQVHILKYKAGNDPVKRMLPYMKFFRNAKRMLKEIAPKLIHVQGLDMLKIAVTYKKSAPYPVRIIYEVADIHRLIASNPRSIGRKVIKQYLLFEDRRCCRDIDLLVVTSPKHVDTYFGNFIERDRILCMPNVPVLSAFAGYHKKPLCNPLVIGYIGSVRYKKQMHNLLDAAKECGLKVMIAGFEIEPAEIEARCKNIEEVEWIGRFDFDTQIADLYSKCNLIYSVYDADIENVRIALPNKLYESIYCRIPIIVAKNTYLAQVVEEWGVGVAVDHREPEELTAVLHKFADQPDYYNRFEQQCLLHKAEVNLERYNALLRNRIVDWFRIK